MRRRGVGVGAVKDLKAGQEKYREKRNLMQENLVEELSKQMEQFRTKLEAFAAKHRSQIKKDPDFRERFQEMCAAIGVDPLASSKGFWSEMLGMGSFYYEVAVQAIEVMLSTSQVNGGFMTLNELKQRMNKSRSKSVKQTEVSCDDILRAINSLNVLGKSCGVIVSGRKKEEYLLFCVPEELSLDNTKVVQYAANAGVPNFTVEDLMKNLGWTSQRVTSVIERLICEGIVWVDNYKGSQQYWFFSLFVSACRPSAEPDLFEPRS